MKRRVALPRFISCHAGRNGQIKAAAWGISLSPPRHFAYRANFDTEMLLCSVPDGSVRCARRTTTHPLHKFSPASQRRSFLPAPLSRVPNYAVSYFIFGTKALIALTSCMFNKNFYFSGIKDRNYYTQKCEIKKKILTNKIFYSVF